MYVMGDVGTEEVESRKLMFIIYKYVHIVIPFRHSPREILTTLGGAIVTNGEDVLCKPILGFLRIT